MPNNLGRFAINADDVPRARRFYEAVFGWTFEPWGPPNFYLIETGEEKVRAVGGLLQERRELVRGQKMIGFECTISVSSVDETAESIVAQGGKIVMPKVVLMGVGKLIFFQDPGGNIVGAMEYDAQAE